MSRIHISIELDSNEPTFSAVLAALGQNANSPSDANDVKVVAAEEVKAEAPAKTPTPRASRAKPKAPPVEEEIEEDEDLDGGETEEEEEQAEEIDADDIRAVQATKVDKHREAIKAQLKKLGATGIKDLDPEHFQKYYDFLSKLK